MYAYASGFSKGTLFILSFWLFLAIIGFLDWRERVIPNACVLITAMLGVLSVLCFSEPNLVQKTVGALIVSVPLFLITLFLPGSFGGGDIKLAAVMGLFLGWKGMLWAFVLASVFAGVYCAVMLIRKK
ncbi:MAG: A24 family peptidase [Lachnospiraceae bacterium]|nr:A24 family peptidase [Lachnospiraceae bacterium]